MRKHLCACFVVVCAAALARAQGPELQEARQRWLKGNYAEALEKYQALAKDDKHRVAATLGMSRCLQSQGEYDKALEAVEALLKDKPKEADLLARRAELLYLRGRWDDAEKAADETLKLDKEHFAARWVRARVYRDRGEIKKADAEFRWFVRTYSDRSFNDKDIKDPEALVLVGLAGCENARWYKLADQFEFILKEVYGDALKYDPDYWPAELQAGLLLLEKYNRAEGLQALDKALTINPNAAEALVGKGVAALQRLELKDAEGFAERALKINPRLPAALRLLADIHLTSGDIDKALKELAEARKVNPRDERTLGRVAACLWMQRKQKEFDAVAEEVKKHDPKPGVFHLTLAERLEDARRYDEAEKHFKKASELRPVLHAATGQLGMLYMRLGREKEAGELLKKAFEADPFNVRVSNLRKVLRHLEKYETIKTAHFELRYDPKTDAALARYMAEYLERIYADLAEKFNHRPKGPILIEVFNNHEMFSGRTVALPDLHTIGACTGRMIAMVSPGGRGVAKPFNWARVLRHELVHIFNLDQSNFLVPHWLTEGLAVSNEGFARPQTWNELLLTRVPSGELLNLDNINLGFMRPRSPTEWNLAYCQGQLYVQYIIKTYGKEAIGELLNAYRAGLDTEAALRKVCRVEKVLFEKGYRKYLEEIVAKMGGKPPPKAMSFSELKAAYEKMPEDLDLAARLAEQYLARDRAKAREMARTILDKKPKHPLASYVLARLEVLGGAPKRALGLLEDGVHRDDPEPKVVRALAKMYYDAGEMEKAAGMFELGRKAQPYDNEWLIDLARVYARLEDRDKQIAALKEYVRTEADELEPRKRLARLLTEAGELAEAERYAREALEIDIKDAEAREYLFKALEGQKKGEEAERLRKLLEG